MFANSRDRSKSPMPFGNSGFPVRKQNRTIKRVRLKSPMPFGNSGFPVRLKKFWILQKIKVTNAFRQFGFPRREYVHRRYSLTGIVTNAFRQFGFPRPFVFDAPFSKAERVTNAFRQFGFPRLKRACSRYFLEVVTNAFRQFGFPRPSITAPNQTSGINKSPMPFGNSGFPVNLESILSLRIHKSHQCLSAIRVSPSVTWMLKE